MCGILLMSQSPPLQSSSNISPFSSTGRGRKSSCGNGTQYMPATKAVDRLILANQQESSSSSSNNSNGKDCQDKLTARACIVAAHWPWKGEQDVQEATVENLGFCKRSNLFGFPAIEWAFSDDEDDSDDDDEDSLSGLHDSGKTALSAPAIMNCYIEGPRRGSLVRSISLVSSIMKEMNSTPDNLSIHKKRMPSSFKAQEKRRTKAKTNRLVALTHPTSLEGLHATRHTGAGKFFL